MNRIELIPRSTGFGDLGTAPGWWTSSVNSGKTPYVLLRCADCKRVWVPCVAAAEDGTLIGRLTCPHEPCRWSVYGVLASRGARPSHSDHRNSSASATPKLEVP